MSVLARSGERYHTTLELPFNNASAITAPILCIGAEQREAPLIFWPIYKLSISSKQLRHIENSIILDKKEGNDDFNIVQRCRTTLGARGDARILGPLGRYGPCIIKRYTVVGRADSYSTTPGKFYPGFKSNNFAGSAAFAGVCALLSSILEIFLIFLSRTCDQGVLASFW